MLYNQRQYNTATYNEQLDRLFVRSIINYIENVVNIVSRTISLDRDPTSYTESVVNIVSRTVSLFRELTNYTGSIVNIVSRTVNLNREIINYTESIINLIYSIPWLGGSDLLGGVKKTGGLNGRLRRWD